MLTALCTNFTSCSKDNDEDGMHNNNIEASTDGDKDSESDSNDGNHSDIEASTDEGKDSEPDSNDGNHNDIEASTDNSNAKMFIGTWSGYGTWTFNADGTCSYNYVSWDGKSSWHTGTWSYNEETKTLITDVLTWNWQILNISENSWTGTHLAGQKNTHTYSRVN